ncbi:pseudaminic acid cytidylyltransferase [sulfur-oxidizing endosymbiont of Gigantopelta aegis]|uniref:pseudaminic acid cytidylyltransferase n=1 Tax=sulfur-oxidizing endosymbiont of Gigantopelta aegis TaxID=2794934 RepID=UPI0018DDE077|nr:pseudaminic acid cytidylyltransferase [sulfur-oxidizing endosymbiont of Gigantopelta aegis]
MNIAIIPARGGSKRIPKKNIKPFLGKPIIAYSIEAALASGLFEQVIVSTDDEEIAEVSRQYGASTPFVRPENLSDDYTGTTPVVNHAIQWCQAQGWNIDYVCCLYATAPFITDAILQQGYQHLIENNKSYTYSVTSFAFPIQRAVKLLEDGRPIPFQPEMMPKRSQDLIEAYHDAGQFYLGTADAFLTGKHDTIATILPRYRVQDIDTLEDWYRAELMYQAIQDKG